MRLFTLDEAGKMSPYNEFRFREKNFEADLENLLEKNPEYFFENSKTLIVGRQVSTNLNTSLDLLGINATGDTIVIELKRDKTPRETIAQLLEYASFVENLDYAQLNEIFQGYSGEEIELEKYHEHYFQNDVDEKVSFNKYSKLVIVAQNISKEIKQTAQYLRKKGLDIFCVEFKYFLSKSDEKIISSDVVVGDEEFLKQKIQSASLPKTNEQIFKKSLDQNGLVVFNRIFDFAKKNKLLIRWGSKGFSLNLTFGEKFVGLIFGYPRDSVFKQSIYTGFEEIQKKVNGAEEIIDFYRSKLSENANFVAAKSNMKWQIEREFSSSEIEQFLNLLNEVISKIKSHGLQEDSNQ